MVKRGLVDLLIVFSGLVNILIRSLGTGVRSKRNIQR